MSQAVHPLTGTAPDEVVENPILREFVWKKMNVENDNWMASVCGETGSGKSWATLRICEIVDPNFTVDQIAFSVLDFMKLVNDDSLGRGSIIMFEEASVEASAHEWWSKSNQILGSVLDTWRNQNRGAIFTHPAFKQLDKTARGRMSALIQMRSKNEDSGYTLGTYKRCQQDSDTGKIYKKYPYVRGKKYKYLKFQKPSKELREAYEEKKSQYTRDLNQELLAELEDELDQGDESVQEDPKSMAQEIIEADRIDEFISDNHGQRYIDRTLIEIEFDVGEKKSRKIKALLKPEVDDDVI